MRWSSPIHFPNIHPEISRTPYLNTRMRWPIFHNGYSGWHTRCLRHSRGSPGPDIISRMSTEGIISKGLPCYWKLTGGRGSDKARNIRTAENANIICPISETWEINHILGIMRFDTNRHMGGGEALFKLIFGWGFD